MIRLFEPRDLDRVMEIWLQGNLEVHSYIDAEYWKKNFDSVKLALPDAEVYVYADGEEILGFIGLDEEYIAGIFVAKGHRGQKIGRRLMETAKEKRRRLSLDVYEKNRGAKAFYLSESFQIVERKAEEATGERECRMVYDNRFAVDAIERRI